MNTLEKVKQWFIDRDLENGGRLDKQSLKLSEEFGELCAGYLKKNEQLTKDSIGDCAVVIVGLALLIKEDVQEIFKTSGNDRDVMTCFSYLSRNISDFQIYQDSFSKGFRKVSLIRTIRWLKLLSTALGYNFDECFELAYQEIKDRKGRWIDGSLFRAWDSWRKRMSVVDRIYIDTEGVRLYDDFGEYWRDFRDVKLMQSTGLRDKNGKEVFEGDILKFNDEWNEYCHEGYVDGSVEGINFVEVVRGEACFEFGKTRYPESSLFIRMEDERLTFAELIKSRDFEFEIIGNIYENPDLLEDKE